MALGQTVSPKPYKEKYNPKYTVFGYVRSSHLSLFKASSYPLLQNVPMSISSLCVKYYEPNEYFDTIYNDEIKTSKDKKTIHKYHQRLNLYLMISSMPFGLENTSFGKVSVPSTSNIVCEWYFKLNNIFHAPNKPFQIGIVSKVSAENKSFMDKPKNEDYKFYGYQFGSGILKSHYRGPPVTDYGKRCEVNDIICMTLDLKKRQIRYSRNNESYGIAFDNIDIGEDIGYRLAVTIGHKYGELSILRYIERL